MDVGKDHEELFALLNSGKVKYLIVGAYAVAFHGHPRNTGDLDIFIASNRANARRMLQVIEKFGFGALGLEESDFSEGEQIVQLGYPPLRVDILTGISGVTFREAWESRVPGEFGKQKVFYLSKAHLIRNKKATGRSLDLRDLELLKRKPRRKR